MALPDAEPPRVLAIGAADGEGHHRHAGAGRDAGEAAVAAPLEAVRLALELPRTPGKTRTERPASRAARAASSEAGMVLTFRRSQPTRGAWWSEVPRFSMTWISGQPESLKNVKYPSSIVSA